MGLTAEQASQQAFELIKTVNSLGWWSVMELAEASVKEAEDAVWACKEKSTRDDLVLKAQAAREFLATFKDKLEVAKDITPKQPFTFAEVSTG